MTETEKTGPEMVEEIALDATIDEVLRRDPREVSPADLEALIVAQRRKRAMFIEKTKAKKESK